MKFPFSSQQLSAVPPTRRIFSQTSYEYIRTIRVVPISSIEALPLAVFFPIAWRVTDETPELVALRSIGFTQPPVGQATLPLVLRAFPFVQSTNSQGPFEPEIAETTPDRPTDVGAPICLTDGALSAGAAQRIRALYLFTQTAPTASQISAYLYEQDLLVPWDLKQRAPEGAVIEDDLYVLRPNVPPSALRAYLKEFGSKGGNLLPAHRISMYKTSALLPRPKPSKRAG